MDSKWEKKEKTSAMSELQLASLHYLVKNAKENVVKTKMVKVHILKLESSFLCLALRG